MGFDQKGQSVFRVVCNAQNKWDVIESGFDKPLATFNSKEEAQQYATGIAKGKEGSRVEAGD